MKVYLQINGQWAQMVNDATQEVQLNFTVDNLENPTAYVSENSYSLKLPKCAENNKYFSQFCQSDSVIMPNGYDPTQRMPYMLVSDQGEQVSTGWAYVSSITDKEYTISLTGSQSKIFSQLLNAGYDTTKAAEDSDYHLMTDWLKMRKIGTMFMDEQTNRLTAQLVYASWRIAAPLFNFNNIRNISNLRQQYGLYNLFSSPVTETQAFICSLVGFAPTAQGKYKDFDNETWLDSGNVNGHAAQNALAYLPVFKRNRDIKGEPQEQFEIEGDILEPQIGEFRSYYQQPYIYVAILWQLFRNEFATITDGYTLNLDSRWFNEANTELARLVYMLPQHYQEPRPTGTPQQLTNLSAVATLPTGSYDQPWSQGTIFVSGLVAASRKTLTSESVTLAAGESVTFSYNLAIQMALKGNEAGKTIYFNDNNPIRVRVSVIGNNCGVGLKSKRYFLEMIPDNGAYNIDSIIAINQYAPTVMSMLTQDSNEMMQPAYTPFASNVQATIDMLTVGDTITVTATEDTTVQLQFYFEFAASQGQTPFSYGSNFANQWYKFSTAPTITYSVTDIVATKTVGRRSNSAVSLESLFGDIKPFSVLMQYSKAHHLLWQVDDINKTVTVKRAADAYADMVDSGIVDISEKVAKNKGITLKPLSWSVQNVVFNLEDINADYIEGYAERAGLTYGSKRIITQNHKDKGTLNLLGKNENDKIATSAMLSYTVAPVASIIANKDKYLFIETEPMPLNMSGDESADIYGNFYYRHSNGNWNVRQLEGWRYGTVYITDDLADEVAFGRFCWHGIDALNWDGLSSLRYACSVRPVLNTVSEDGLSVHFAAVREQYTQYPDEPTTYLYGKCWQNYIEEVYNPQNKVVELYLVLDVTTLAQVRSNPIVQIGNVVYLLTDIKGWSERGQICKCTLRQITDINNLTT